jgi:RimJ/RimL family protein N-acetyltransferase
MTNQQFTTTDQTKRSPATSGGDPTRRPTPRRISSGSLATSFTLAVATLEGELIGVANLAITGEPSTGELGYVLSRESWGHGYATEVARRLINFGFDDLGLRRITATCHPDNLASARVLEKSGMHPDGIIRDHRQVLGEWRDSRLFAISTDDKHDHLKD